MPDDAAQDPGQLAERRYDEEADLYAAVVEPVYRPLLEALLERAELRPGERVLDLGSGSGLLARMAAERVGPEGYVLGIDVAEGMVRVARRRAGDVPQLSFERQDANALSLSDASFDAALSSFALPFTDPNRSLPELHRVLRPEGGRLAAILSGLNWGLSYEVRAAISAARARHLSPEAVEWVREIDASRKRADARWALLAPDVLEARLLRLGFRYVAYERNYQPFTFEGPREVWNWHYAGTGLRRFIADWPAERQAAFHDDVTDTVASVLGTGPITLEWEVIHLLAAK